MKKKMKINSIYRSIYSVLALSLILSVFTFVSNESKGSEVSAGKAQSSLLLVVSNVSLSPGTYAYADGPGSAGGHYVATVTGTNRVGFTSMPAGNYHIVICGSTPTGAYNYLANGFYFNGTEQTNRINLVKGFCNPE